jgi:hypothetical protein
MLCGVLEGAGLRDQAKRSKIKVIPYSIFLLQGWVLRSRGKIHNFSCDD